MPSPPVFSSPQPQTAMAATATATSKAALAPAFPAPLFLLVSLAAFASEAEADARDWARTVPPPLIAAEREAGAGVELADEEVAEDGVAVAVAERRSSTDVETAVGAGRPAMREVPAAHC